MIKGKMMNLLTIEQLTKLNTKRLLAYKNKLYKCLWEPEDYVWDCDSENCFCADERKQLDNLKKNIELVKVVLKSREHIDRKVKC
jgi:hypothetical protein